ncbi:MAG: MOSC domain-containing protein [Rhizobiaceae bacterium]
MKLCAVNISPLEPMSVQGDNIGTGFYKQAQLNAVNVVREGICGDARGALPDDMSRSIFMYQSLYYDEWREELNRPLPFGTFGENLTFDGPPDTEMYLGDVLQIGSVILKITQPRFPCRKMTVRMEEGDDFPLRYLRSGRLGFFCSVEQSGVLSVENSVKLIHRVSDNPISLSEFSRVTYLEPHDQLGLRRLLESEELVLDWRLKVERLLRRARGPVNSWNTYRPLTARCHKSLTSDVVKIELHDPSGDSLPNFEAGQFLTLELDLPGVDKSLVRTYTIVGRSHDDQGYQLAIKREGLASGYLHDHVKQGSAIKALPPRGHFVVEPGKRPIVLLSAGIGITPMLAMLRELSICPLKRDVLFVHCARSGQEHVFADEVRELVATSDQLSSHVVYSHPRQVDSIGEDYDSDGRLTVETLANFMKSLNADYYMCGPVSFMRDMARGLAARGVPKDNIRYEFFGVGDSLFEDELAIDDLPDAVDGQGRPISVTFASSGVVLPWKEGLFSILSLADRNGLSLPASCRTGLCGICTCRMDSGDIEYVVEPLDRPKLGEVMVCCSRPTSSIVLDL